MLVTWLFNSQVVSPCFGGTERHSNLFCQVISTWPRDFYLSCKWPLNGLVNICSLDSRCTLTKGAPSLNLWLRCLWHLNTEPIQNFVCVSWKQIQMGFSSTNSKMKNCSVTMATTISCQKWNHNIHFNRMVTCQPWIGKGMLILFSPAYSWAFAVETKFHVIWTPSFDQVITGTELSWGKCKKEDRQGGRGREAGRWGMSEFLPEAGLFSGQCSFWGFWFSLGPLFQPHPLGTCNVAFPMEILCCSYRFLIHNFLLDRNKFFVWKRNDLLKEFHTSTNVFQNFKISETNFQPAMPGCMAPVCTLPHVATEHVKSGMLQCLCIQLVSSVFVILMCFCSFRKVLRMQLVLPSKVWTVSTLQIYIFSQLTRIDPAEFECDLHNNGNLWAQEKKCNCVWDVLFILSWQSIKLSEFSKENKGFHTGWVASEFWPRHLGAKWPILASIFWHEENTPLYQVHFHHFVKHTMLVGKPPDNLEKTKCPN